MRKPVICQRMLLKVSIFLMAVTLILCPAILTQAIETSPACKLEVIQPSSADTYIDSVWSDTNNDGGGLSIHVTEFKSLRSFVKFDLSSIPLGSSVNTASLKLYFSGIGAVYPTGRTFMAYRVSNDWVENEATWNSYQTGSPWDTAGGDYSTDGASSTPAPSSLGTWVTWDVTSIVKAWIEDGQPNYGFLLRDLNEGSPPFYGANFDSRESIFTGWRPILEIDWCEALPIVEPEPVGGELLSFYQLPNILIAIALVVSLVLSYNLYEKKHYFINR